MSLKLNDWYKIEMPVRHYVSRRRTRLTKRKSHRHRQTRRRRTSVRRSYKMRGGEMHSKKFKVISLIKQGVELINNPAVVRDLVVTNIEKFVDTFKEITDELNQDIAEVGLTLEGKDEHGADKTYAIPLGTILNISYMNDNTFNLTGTLPDFPINEIAKEQNITNTLFKFIMEDQLKEGIMTINEIEYSNIQVREVE
jgi:hypothetical protein